MAYNVPFEVEVSLISSGYLDLRAPHLKRLALTMGYFADTLDRMRSSLLRNHQTLELCKSLIWLFNCIPF